MILMKIRKSQLDVYWVIMIFNFLESSPKTKKSKLAEDTTPASETKSSILKTKEDAEENTKKRPGESSHDRYNNTVMCSYIYHIFLGTGSG